MSLQFIIGNSGSGKSYELYRKIIKEAIDYPDKRFLVIVPEQFTMQTQRELVMLHPQKGIMNIDVLSFQRLAYRIFEEVGADTRKVLDETGKNLLLRKVVIEKQESFKSLGKNLKKTGYITQMKSMISELTQYDISQAQMEILIESAKENPQLYYKLQDVQILYEGFREKRKDQYRTSEETLDILCQVADRSDMLKGSVIALDGFTGFTPLQQKLLQKLMIQAECIMVTVTLDAKEDPYRLGGMHQLFYLSRKTLHMLMQTAKETGTEMIEPIVLGKEKSGRFADSPALHFMERHLLRYDKSVYMESQEEISIHAAQNAVEEVRFAARTICTLVREKGCRYQDIAVITGDMNTYSPYIPRIFREYQVPIFLDETKKVLLNPFIEFIRSALELIAKNYSYDSVFRYLRTGMCGIGREETDMLENYVLAAGIKGFRAWEETWERTTQSFTEDNLKQCNEIRQKVMIPLTAFTKAMKEKKGNVKSKTIALYELIAAHEIQKRLAWYRETFDKEGKLDEAREFTQIYGIVMDLLDKLVELLGNEILTLKEYTEILEAGFEETQIGLIPPASDRILIGDIERTRLKDIKVLIFLGLNDGWVPKSGDGSGIITDMERSALASSGVVLAPTEKENSYIQRFYLYMNLTKPGERLYLSYGKAGIDGSAMRPSYIVRHIMKLFPAIAVTDEDRYSNPINRILTAKSGIPYLLEGMKSISKGDVTPSWMELYSWYYESENYHEKVTSLVNAAFMKRGDCGLGKQAANALYGETLMNSVSRLEQYAACAFAHFIKYGLRLKEREEYIFQPMDMGNIFHSVIENFSKKVERSNYTWSDMPADMLDMWTEECVEEVTGEYGAKILHSSARNEYAVVRMKRIMRRTLWALCEQVKAGSFQPENYEVSFSMAKELEAVNISLTEEENMKLQGRIDRIDTCEKEDQVYVKVIDYKSGSRSFDLVELYYGLQLQLVVYLNAAMEMEKKVHPEKEVVPAGIFYYLIQDPVINRTVKESLEIINEKLLKELKLSGLVNEDPEIIKEMDKKITTASNVIPVTLKKDGSPSLNSSTVSGEQFAVLSSYVNEKMRTIGREIIGGKTEALPYERKDRTACDYCSYHEICGFDTKIPGTHFKRLRELKGDELWEKLKGDI